MVYNVCSYNVKLC